MEPEPEMKSGAEQGTEEVRADETGKMDTDKMEPEKKSGTKQLSDESVKKFLKDSDAKEYPLPEDKAYPQGHRNQFHHWMDEYLMTVKKRKESYYSNVKTPEIEACVKQGLNKYSASLERARECKNSLTYKDISYTSIMDDFMSITDELNQEIDKVINCLLDMHGEIESMNTTSPDIHQGVTSKSGLRMERQDIITDLQECAFLKYMTNDFYKIKKEAELVKASRQRRLSFKAHKAWNEAVHSTSEKLQAIPKIFHLGRRKSESSDNADSAKKGDTNKKEGVEKLETEEKPAVKADLDQKEEAMETEQKTA